jgi:hypothetical protein
MIVADTDVLIDFLEGHQPGAHAVAAALAAGRLQTTVIRPLIPQLFRRCALGKAGWPLTGKRCGKCGEPA